ncbi:hypothetical protein P3S67_016198 [Capsicum chacoense]
MDDKVQQWSKQLIYLAGICQILPTHDAGLIKQIVEDTMAKLSGINMQKQKLWFKKILLVFDDADHMDQLDASAGKREWVGPRSRVIITTKDKHLLVKHGVEKKYRMRTLSENESMHSRFNILTSNFEELSAQLIKYARCWTPLRSESFRQFLLWKRFG